MNAISTARWIGRLGLVIITLLALGTAGNTASAAGGRSAVAEVMDARGRVIGVATFVEQSDGVRVSLRVSTLKAGNHGIHIHAAGTCQAPGFTSAGGHFNPAAAAHGLENPVGPHAGDIPNLVVAADGTGSLTYVNPRVTLMTGSANSLLQPGGTALVIHAGADDNMTDPSGNSGDRIACGVITASTRTLTVGTATTSCDGTCDFTSITAAIAGAAAGDTVVVYPGQYQGPFTVDKSITLIAAGDREATILDGTGAHAVMTITASGARLVGFTVQNGDKEGVDVMKVNDVTIAGNLMRGNGRIPAQSFMEAANSILIASGKGNLVLNNSIVDNGSRGVRIEGFAGPAENNVVRGNYIARNRSGGNIPVCALVATTNVMNNLIEHNRLEDNENGFILAALVPGSFAKGNIFQDNDVRRTFADPGFLIAVTASPNITDNIIRYNHVEANVGTEMPIGVAKTARIGIQVVGATNNQLYGNTLVNEDYGFVVTPGPNEIRDNIYVGVGTQVLQVTPPPAEAPAAAAPAPQAPAQAPAPAAAQVPAQAPAPAAAAQIPAQVPAALPRTGDGGLAGEPSGWGPGMGAAAVLAVMAALWARRRLHQHA